MTGGAVDRDGSSRDGSGLAPSAFGSLLGSELKFWRGGEAEVHLPFRDDLLQRAGFLHGAVVSYLADTACARAAASLVGECRTAEYKINFLAPGAGELFIGRGHVVKATRRTAIARADVFAVKDGAEKLIAIATATLMRV